MDYAMTRQEELQSIFWDMYKDAHGFRPRGFDCSGWTEEDFNDQFEYLARVIQENYQRQLVREEMAIREFEQRMAAMMQSYSIDRATAMSWIHEAEETGGDDEYLCYTLSLPYRYFAVDKVAV